MNSICLQGIFYPLHRNARQIVKSFFEEYHTKRSSLQRSVHIKHNIGVMVAQHLRRWSNIMPTLA